MVLKWMWFNLVATRNADPFAELQKNKCADYFNDQYGQSGFTRTRRTDTLNVSGRIKSSSESTISLVGDMQFVTVKEIQIIKEGLANLGDGMFYTQSKYDLTVDDEITTPQGDKYRLTTQVEGETTKGQEIYQGWLCVLLNE